MTRLASLFALVWVFWSQSTGWMAFPTKPACEAAVEAVEALRDAESSNRFPSLRELVVVNCREIDGAASIDMRDDCEPSPWAGWCQNGKRR